jgi:hypothetical protein
MSAYEQLERFYREHLRTTLARDVRRYAKCGYVFIGPDHVLIGRRHDNGWFIRAAIGVGLFRRFSQLMPYYLPWIGWARVARGRSGVVWHSTDKLLRIVNYEQFKQIQVMPPEGSEDREILSVPGSPGI